MREHFCEEQSDVIVNWSLQHWKWRLYYVIFEMLDENLLQLEIPEHLPTNIPTQKADGSLQAICESNENEDEDKKLSKTVYQEIVRVLQALINQGTAKNFRVKHLSVFQLFPLLVNKSQKLITHTESSVFMTIIEQAMSIEWGNKKDNIDYLQPLVNLNKDFLENGGVVLGNTK